MRQFPEGKVGATIRGASPESMDTLRNNIAFIKKEFDAKTLTGSELERAIQMLKRQRVVGGEEQGELNKERLELIGILEGGVAETA